MDSDYARTSPREFVLDVARAVNDDGSKKYKLDIALNTLVTKVNFDTSSARPRATGVDYLAGKSLYRADTRASRDDVDGVPGSVNARREVIVAGGTFNTPQILKLSGIGPASELRSHGIPVVRDLPGVGGNLQDRYEVGIAGNASSDFSLLRGCTFLEGEDPCYDKWKNNRLAALKGTYATNGLAFGYIHHSSVAEGDPDLYLGGAPALFDGYYPGYAESATSERNIWTWLTLKAHSRSRAGTVNLTTADPRDTPRIAFRSALGEGAEGQADLQALYEGAEYGLQAFASLIPLDGGGGFERIWPDPERVPDGDEAALRRFIRDEAWGHHACCTAPIGADDDAHAVLDADLRVRGVDGLRVVDASVFPRIPGTYIVLPIYMVSEKAADAILAAAREDDAA